MIDFDSVYAQHVARVYAYLCAAVGDATVAEDLTAEVFVRLWLHRHRLHTPAHITAWLFRTARTVAIDHHRTLGRTAGRLLPLDTVALTLPSPEATIIATEDWERVRAALSRLPEREQTVLRFRFVAGLRNSEIAQVLGLRAGHVAKIVHRALHTLRALLQHDQARTAAACGEVADELS